MVEVESRRVGLGVRQTSCGEEESTEVRRQVQGLVESVHGLVLVDVSAVARQEAVVGEGVEHGADTTSWPNVLVESLSLFTLRSIRGTIGMPFTYCRWAPLA